MVAASVFNFNVSQKCLYWFLSVCAYEGGKGVCVCVCE